MNLKSIILLCLLICLGLAVGRPGQVRSPGPTDRKPPLIGALERPSRAVPVSPFGLPLCGWAVGPTDLARLTASVDGRSINPIIYGESRPDAARRHPEYGRREIGFRLVAPADCPGPKILLIKITDLAGRELELKTEYLVAEAAPGG